MRIQREDAVAIVVDYQEKLMPIMRDKEQLVQNSVILLQGLKVLDIPMYITQQYTKGLGHTVTSILDAVNNSKDEATDQATQLEEEVGYIEKIRFSAFEDVKPYIGDKKYVIVCGIEAHICVLQTVIDLANAGYTPVLVVDCISSRREADMTFAIVRAKAEGAILTTYEAILFELLQEAGTTTSKSIQRLIK